jgi:hypothetical protein
MIISIGEVVGAGLFAYSAGGVRAFGEFSLGVGALGRHIACRREVGLRQG